MKVFSDVASLEAATLTAGQLVETKGYYSSGDGGQARYLIKTAVDYGATPDEDTDLTLANGNVAVLQTTDLYSSGISSEMRKRSAVMIIGDSISEGTGATYATGVGYITCASILNASNNGYAYDEGYKWPVVINQSNAQSAGYSTNGAISATGVIRHRLSLDAGEAITVTERDFAYVWVTYDADVSTGSLVIAKNGTTLSTQAVSGTGLQTTTSVSEEFTEDDTLTITASGGTIVVTAVYTLAGSSDVQTLVYIAAESGSAYQDYTDEAGLDELAYYMNEFRSSYPKVWVLNLGTNNLYNSGKAKTPAEYTALIGDFVAGINSRCSNNRYVISIPPKANEGIFPLIKSGYTYSDYVVAILAYCRENGHQVIRYDQTVLRTDTSLYVDGVHPNAEGHLVMAEKLCGVLGVPVNYYIRTTVPSFDNETREAITYNDTWGAFTGSSSFDAVAHKNGNIVHLSGIIQPNASSATQIGTLPSGYRPVGRTVYLSGRDNSGYETITITSAGAVSVGSASLTWLSLEGISFPIERTPD